MQALSGASLDHLTLDDLLHEAREYAVCLTDETMKPILCGHSNGALLALALVAEGRVSHAILLAPVPPPSISSGVPVWLQKLFFSVSFGLGWSSGVLRFDRQRRLDPDPPAAEIAASLLPDGGRVLCDALSLSRRGHFDPKPPLETPFAVIAGERDRICPPAIARRVATRYNADFHTIQNAGHWFPAKERFAEEVAGLIACAIDGGVTKKARSGTS